LPQLDVIEYFAVEADPDAMISVRHRLLPVDQIYDAESGVGKTNASLIMEALTIGTSMTYGGDHAFKQFRRFRGKLPLTEKARYTTHEYT
jgi:hypothetical protein